jgi:Ca2+-binding RTX toxin-like protein
MQNSNFFNNNFTNESVDLQVNPDTQLVTVNDSSPTVSVMWDKAVQQAVINTSPGPTVASRAYAMMHTAMFDAWSAYNPQAISTQLADYLQRPTAEITEENKSEAMSYAAYQVLNDLFPTQTQIFDELMGELGLNPNNNTTDTTTAAGVGNVMARELLEFRRLDGSNQLDNYSENGDYQPVNAAGETIQIDLWTPELVPIDAEPGEEIRVQQFLTPQWGDVTPFALESGEQFRPEAPQPFLLVDAAVDLENKTITLENGSVLDIDKSLVGTIINPEFVAQAQEVVNISANLTDEQKLVAEFWEDGGGTSFPPGTWMTFGQFVSARDNNTLDQDAQLFFGLGNAVFDAGIATWEAKTFYDYARPIRAIRELGELGLIGEFNQELDGFAIDAWKPGEGTQTILATDFLTYQTPGGDASPPFAEYTSGHSSFSAAGASILELFTGSDEFGASVSFDSGESRFEPGQTPSEAVTLQWDTFSEAADEAGISRLYGGIHFTEGDVNGRTLGEQVGQAVWDKTQFFINGGDDGVINPPQPIVGTREDDVLNGGREDDILNAGRGDDILNAGRGDDILNAGRGDDILNAGRGDDILNAGRGDDILNAGRGDDILNGGRGDDILNAGRGDDILNGYSNSGTQFDTLIGGRGDDTFVLGGVWGVSYQGEGYATIEDWNYLEDTIQVIGNSSQYSLQFDDLSGNSSLDTLIFSDSDLIAVVQDATNLSVSRDFSFV